MGKAALGRRSFFDSTFRVPVSSIASTTIIYGLFFLLIGLPLFLVMVQVVFPNIFDPNTPSLMPNIAGLDRIFASPRFYASIFHSVELASVVGVCATILGGAFAVIIQRCDIPFRKWIGAIPWMVFLTPAYLKTVAWVLLMSPGGYLAEFGLLPPITGSLFFAFPGLAFIHTLGLFPFATFIIGNALRGLGSEMEDAARLGGVSLMRTWTRINLPLLAPAIALSFIAIFAQVLSDFGLASTIARISNFSVLTYDIYAATSAYPIDFQLAGTQSVVLLGLISIALLLERLLRQRGNFKLISGRSRPTRDYRLGVWRWGIVAVALLIGLIALALPIGAVIIRALTRTLSDGMMLSNFTFANIVEAADPHSPVFAALAHSLHYAMVAASLSCVVAVLLAVQLEGAGKVLKGPVMGISLASVAIPGIVFGFGYILMWNRLPGFRDSPFPHYGEVSLLITGYIGVAAPYALIVILSAINQLAPSLNDSAKLFGVGPVRRMIMITLPLIAMSVATAFVLNFIHIMFELPISQMLIPRTETPAPIYVLRLLNYDKDGLACALSLFSMVIAGAMAVVPWAIYKFMTMKRGAILANPNLAPSTLAGEPR